MKITERRNASDPMSEGDVIALYGTDTSYFRLAIAQGVCQKIEFNLEIHLLITVTFFDRS